MSYYIIAAVALYLTALFRIFIPAELIYSELEYSSTFEIAVRQTTWAVLTLLFAPYYFIVIMSRSTDGIIKEMVENLLKD